MTSMRERAEGVRGRLTVESEPARRHARRAELPLEPEATV